MLTILVPMGGPQGRKVVVEGPEWRKAAHIMVARKWREKGGGKER